MFQQPVKVGGEQGEESEEGGSDVRHCSVGAVAHHQPGPGAHPGVVVAGGEVGQGAHAVPDVVILLHPRHLQHVLQHGGQVILGMLVPCECLNMQIKG